MSTRSYIAIAAPHEDRIRFIYCHSDGYPEWNGNILLRHFNTELTAAALVQADISGIGYDGMTDPCHEPDPAGDCTLAELPALAEKSWAEFYLWRDGAWHIAACRRQAESRTGWPAVQGPFTEFTPLASRPEALSDDPMAPPGSIPALSLAERLTTFA